MKRYPLPELWCSPGIEGWFLANGVAGRTPWEEIKTKDLANAIIVFHLDDVVLTEHGKTRHVVINKGTRFTLFDQLLKTRDPDEIETNHHRESLDTNYLRAETRCFVTGAGFEETTRLIFVEGRFYDVKEGRVLLGAERAVGARAAELDAHPRRDVISTSNEEEQWTTYELHLIDTAAEHMYDGQPTELWHLLVYVGLRVVVEEGAHIGPTDFSTHVMLAESRWGMGHPSSTTPTKDYALVPKDSSQANPPRLVVRMRFFFGYAPEGRELLVIHVDMAPEVGGKSKYAYVRSQGKPRTMHISQDVLSQKHWWLKKQTTDSDQVWCNYLSLAHEMGHVMGIGDEYPDTVQAAPEETTASGLHLLGLDQYDHGRNAVPGKTSPRMPRILVLFQPRS